MREPGINLGGRKVSGGARAEIRSPFDQSVVNRVGFAAPEQLEAAARIAWEARGIMARLSLFERVRILRAASSLIEKKGTELAGAIRDEAGKPIALAEAEARRAVETFAAAAAEAERLGGEGVPLDASASGRGRFGVVRRFPVGPVLAVTPFNFPLNLVAHKVAPAVAAGCPVVVKPASQTPGPALALADILSEAGLPQGGMSVVPARGGDAARLVEDPRFRLVTFTGSAAVGWDIRKRAARARVTLELGGNAAAVVGPDADLDKAVPELAFGAFAYAGQVCISVQRIFVFESVFDGFVSRFVDHVRASVKSGDPRDPGVLCGPLITPKDADRVEAWIAEAVSAGATTLLAPKREGSVVSPCVLTGVDPSLRVVREEAFGPVAVVEKVASWDEAVDRVNDSDYGLQAGVYTQDLTALWRCFERIEAGAIIHNDAPTFRVDLMPYGGVKRSGMGREGPRYAILEMTEPRLLVLRS